MSVVSRLDTNGVSIFDPELVTDLVDKVKGKSALTSLSANRPIPFNGQKEFVFTMDDEVDIVAENGKKSAGSLAITPRTILPIKFEYGARLSDEFMYATEEEQIEILKSFNDGFAKKVARGIDIAAMHGLNPRTKSASTVVGNNHFDYAIQSSNKVTTSSSSDANDEVEAAIALVQAAEEDVTGIAMAPAFRSSLAKIRLSNGEAMFPSLAWGSAPGSINGLPVEVNSTVAFNNSKDLAIVGNFQTGFRWGYSKEIPLEIIRYGDPDNSGNDLKGYNQVYVRAEIYLGWAILDDAMFALIVSP